LIIAQLTGILAAVTLDCCKDVGSLWVKSDGAAPPGPLTAASTAEVAERADTDERISSFGGVAVERHIE
jgi:hypothetical protein